MKIKLRRPTKRQLLVAIGGGLLLLLVAYGVASWLFWANYEQNHTARQQDFIGKINQAIRLPADSQGRREAKLLKLVKLSESSLRSAQDACAPNSIFAWQEIIPALSSARERCQATSNQSIRVADRLDDLVGYLRLEDDLAQIMAKASDHSNSAAVEGEFDSAAEAWSQAKSAIEVLPESQHFNSVKAEAIDLATKLTKGWQELSLASSEEDEARFVTSRNQISDLYSQVDVVGKQAEQSSSRLIESFAATWGEL